MSTENMETLFSIDRFDGGARFCNYSKQATMFIKIEEYVVIILPDSFFIWPNDFEISKLKIFFE